jgi:carboxyl-terminal processing protease
MYSLVLIAAVLLAPQNYYGRIGRQVGNMLHRLHISQRPLDAEMSQRAWTNLVTYYDIDHSVFLKSDLDELAKRDKTLGAELRRSDVSFGYDVHNLFLRRLDERIDFATNLLAKGEWDFTAEEYCPVKRKDAPWPETREEAEEYWRKRIKNEVLAMRIGRELDEADKQNKTPETGEADEDDDDDSGDRKNETVEERLIKKYRQYSRVLNEPDEESVLQYYLSAVARAYDPHTDYMSKTTKEDFDMEMNLRLGGVGAELGMDEDDGALKIGRVMPDGPIDRDGRIKKGDKITGIKNGDGEIEDILWQPIKKSINKIRGPKGTEVTLEIQPKGDPKTRNLITLTRDIVILDDQAATGRVERIKVDGREFKLGYVFLPSFYGTMDKRFGDEDFRSCALDVNRYIADFNAEGVDGLVLDLRGNGGGSLREAVLLSSLFVPRGPVLQVKDIHTVVAYPLPAGNVVAFRKPMIVMIDRESASASEIVAGHLQDVGRAVLVGDSRTHGKGTVQEVDELGAKKYGAVKITNARFYRINGRSTQTEGVSPDIYLPSLLDSLDIGEDKLTYSLPFSEVDPAEYSACWNAGKMVPQLKSASDARLKGNSTYQDHLKSVNGMKAVVERTEVPLEYESRKAMMRNDRDLRELSEADGEGAEEKIASRRRGNQRKKDDVVLDEAFRILVDMVILNDGELLPEPKGWWE